MSFTFGISTKAIVGAGKLSELHTQINAPTGVVCGKKALGVNFLNDPVMLSDEDCIEIYQKSFR